MRTDRKKDLDKYYNDHLKLHIVRRLMMVDTWSEIKGIQSAVYEALDREDKAEQAEKEAGAEAPAVLRTRLKQIDRGRAESSGDWQVAEREGGT